METDENVGVMPKSKFQAHEVERSGSRGLRQALCLQVAGAGRYPWRGTQTDVVVLDVSIR